MLSRKSHLMSDKPVQAWLAHRLMTSLEHFELQIHKELCTLCAEKLDILTMRVLLTDFCQRLIFFGVFHEVVNYLVAHFICHLGVGWVGAYPFPFCELLDGVLDVGFEFLQAHCGGGRGVDF